MWQRRSILLKLSRQTELLEDLAEISVDRLGAITSAADGRNLQYFNVTENVRETCLITAVASSLVSLTQARGKYSK